MVYFVYTKVGCFKILSWIICLVGIIEVWLWIDVSIMLFALFHVAVNVDTYTMITMYAMLDMIAMILC